MTTHEIAGWVLTRTRRRFRAVVSFSIACVALQAIVVGPILAFSLRQLLQRWGRASIGNFEIASFLLSPPGVAAIFAIGTISLSIVYLELAGLMRLLVDEQLKWWQALLGTGQLIVRLVRLGLRQLALYVLLAVPFLAGIGVVYALLWSQRDLNGLIILRPPVFWTGVALAGAFATAYIVVAGRWFLTWSLALPAMLFEPNLSAAGSLQWSTRQTAGHHRRFLGGILLWGLGQLVLASVVYAALRWGSAIAIDATGQSLAVALPMTAALLMTFAVAAVLLAAFSTVTLAGLMLAYYRYAAGHPLPDHVDPDTTVPASKFPIGFVTVAGLLALAIVTSMLSHRLLSSLALDDRVEITAHRAGAMHSPENSVAALRQAVLDRADWAEIDVQLTSDNVLVILHDIDLARIGGGTRRVDAVTFDELRVLDIGTPVDPKFAGEKVPTLEEMLEAAGRQIRMNVELKPHGKLDETALTERVVAAIQKAGMVERCRLCSQSYASLQWARRLEPSLPIGFIAGASIGDLAQLNVDFLMVRSELITRALVERAAASSIRVHAWTVNDPSSVARLLDDGVANLITDDPAVIRGRLDEIRSLTAVDRLLLRARSEFTAGRDK